MGRKHTSTRKERMTFNGKKFKSIFEADIAKYLDGKNLPINYEPDTFDYIRKATYTPDWKISDTVYVESKGHLTQANRSNLIAFKQQHPEVEIILLFADSRNKLYRGSKTTYAEWAEKHGFRWADWNKHKFPEKWFTDANN